MRSSDAFNMLSTVELNHEEIRKHAARIIIKHFIDKPGKKIITYKKQVILLMVLNGQDWHYIAVKW